MSRCFLNTPLNAGFAATVSARALIIFDPTLPANYAGMAICDRASNEPIVLIQPYLQNSPLFGLVLAHEMEHVRQSINYKGGCREFGKRYEEDLIFRVDIEAEAYCKVLDSHIKVEYYEVALNKVIRDVYSIYGEPAGLTFLETEAHVMRYCRPASPPILFGRLK